MTRPPAPALTAVLDELDGLRAKATPGWNLVGGTHDRVVIDGLGEHVCETLQPTDAALIVAAVNRLPQLTAALRAVLAEHDGIRCPDRTFESLRGVEPCPTVAAITTALEAS